MLANVLAGLSILVIGDSHMASPNNLLNPLHEALLKQGAQVHSIGICGTNPGDWIEATAPQAGCQGYEGAERVGDARAKVLGSAARTQPIAQLLERDKPELLVVVMGDTMAAYDRPSFPRAWAWQSVSALTKAITESQVACVWVGPGWGEEGGKFGKTYARAEQVSKFLAETVSPPCHYVDSLTFSKPGAWVTLDGQHYSRSGYQRWTQSIVDALANVEAVRKLKPR